MSPSFESVPICEAAFPADTDKPRPVVLVVDDEKTIADTLAIILSRNGFAAITAYDGESALDIAGTIPPELLLSDVRMPGMSGIDLAISVTRKVKDCKVLLFSGQSSTIDLITEARAAGRNFQILTKPIHPDFLIDCIRRTLAPPIASSAPARFDETDWAKFSLSFRFGE
ncbi:MAG TPA: response regulator [Silvibacterium sp.]|nr:response regulator [Silvibacterium sp.]